MTIHDVSTRPNGSFPLESPRAADIRISILSDHEWRVCDRRIPDNNAECVLGYVEKTGSFFEVMKLASPRNLLYFTDFDHALQCFTADVTPVTVSHLS